ncbi:MAG: GNAT family N-acetyltransferase [Acidobacteriota bacterium]|nr:GNAT family N-acetyltransferase [Acidobacteriota bacterium]
MSAGDGGSAEAAATPAAPSIRPATAGDAAEVARLHATCISDGFLSSLGEAFLTRLYRRMSTAEGSFLFVAVTEGGVAGFVAGTVSTRALFSTFLRRDGPAVVLHSGLTMLRSWRHVLETLRHGSSSPSGARADGELLAIAVGPACRREGVGAQLVERLLGEMAGRGARTVEVVVGADNAGAISMYRRAGFVERRRLELHAGIPSLVLEHGGRAPSP